MTAWNAGISARFGTGGPALVMLDLDGTLIDSVPDLHKAVNVMLAELRRPAVTAVQVSHWVGNGLDMLLRRTLTLGDEEAALALPASDLVTAHHYFDPAYRATLDDATGVYPGVEEWFAATTVSKVLITNKSRQFTLPLVASLGWNERFVQLLCGDDLAEKKPSALPLLHACATWQVDPQQALMIGDSRTDMRAARAAGIACAAVTYGYNHGEDIRTSSPDWVVNRLTELLA